MKNSIPQRLRELRGKASQGDFAKELGLIQQTYSRWESGARKPDLDEILNISNHFGVTTDWLLGHDGGEKESREPAKPPGVIISTESVERLIAQNSDLCQAAIAMGRAHETLANDKTKQTDVIAEQQKTIHKLVELCAEKHTPKDGTPAAATTGGGRAMKHAAAG